MMVVTVMMFDLVVTALLAGTLLRGNLLRIGGQLRIGDAGLVFGQIVAFEQGIVNSLAAFEALRPKARQGEFEQAPRPFAREGKIG